MNEKERILEKKIWKRVIKALLLEFLLKFVNEERTPYESGILKLEELSEEVLKEYKKKLSERHERSKNH